MSDILNEKHEQRRKHLIESMRKLKIDGIQDNSTIPELKSTYLMYKQERNRLVLDKSYAEPDGNIDKKWVMERIQRCGVKTKIKRVGGKIIPPLVYMEIIQEDIFALNIRNGIVSIVMKNGGKFNYSVKSGKLIQ
jgi:hypothetical protein